MARKAKKRELASAAEKTKELLSESATQAVSVLVALMCDEEQKPDLRMKAAESILDRVCGKAGSATSTESVGIPDCIRFEGVLEEWSQ